MKPITKILLAGIGLVLIGGGAAGGYWYGNRQAMKTMPDSATADAARPTATAEKPAEKKLLYYRNPMGLPDTSPVPKKDWMGMDYLPVYEGEEPDSGGGGIKISLDKVQKLGVRTEAAMKRNLMHPVRAEIGRAHV